MGPCSGSDSALPAPTLSPGDPVLFSGSLQPGGIDAADDLNGEVTGEGPAVRVSDKIS